MMLTIMTMILMNGHLMSQSKCVFGFVFFKKIITMIIIIIIIIYIYIYIKY